MTPSPRKNPANFRHGVTCGARTDFQVWAPAAQQMEVAFTDGSTLAMKPSGEGFWIASVGSSLAGRDYRFLIDASDAWPDPASRFQPEGVHGPSRVMDLTFPWTDSRWRGPKLEHYIIYELHVGTFTTQGGLAAIADKIGHLRDLGVTAVELMPVAQFPGRRNWGYDGVYPFAVQNSYGGPKALQQLVDTCHENGLAVVLDVVYNHLGPEGNYLGKFGPYFTDRYRTPWGQAINYDGPHSDGVRRFFIENALHWISEFHIDALRLDAIHGIFDQSAYPFLEELADEVHALGSDLGRNVYLIAETNLNDPRSVRSKARGGIGLDALWNDDFHHALRTVLTGDKTGYYGDFGSLMQVGKAFREGFVYTGEHSEVRQSRYGRPAPEMTPEQFVVFGTNHDQIGNRVLGDRLSTLLTFEELKLAAGAVLLSHFVPLLFMGEEYKEIAPFAYFIEHSDPGLIENVRLGRAADYAWFAWQGVPPDPQAAETFESSKLNWLFAEQEPQRTMLRYYRALIQLRKDISDTRLQGESDRKVLVDENNGIIEVRSSAPKSAVWLLLNFADHAVDLPEPATPCNWRLRMDSSSAEWGGPGSAAAAHLDGRGRAGITLQPKSLVLYQDTN